MPQNTVDILEKLPIKREQSKLDYFAEREEGATEWNDFQPEVLALLLYDHTTEHHIIWCTHDYESLGDGYSYYDEMMLERITGEHGDIIKPRVLKTKEQQADRVKDMAEVFTPSQVVKMMVDYVDIDINTRCLEITCGELL